MALLTISNLSTYFKNSSNIVKAVDGVSLSVNEGQTTALVGESGSGKSVTALSVLQLLNYPKAYHPNGEILFKGENLLNAPKEVLRQIRGNEISMIFQEPMTSLNPLHTIEKQISETLLLHKKMTPKQAKARCLELLNLVELKQFKHRLDAYPHQLSGGQRQRVMIAMALANEPDLLIADEPTTALDVTVQAQILKLLRSLQSELKMAILMITHDLTIVRSMADHIAIMHQGKIVEQGKTKTIFAKPKDPYTKKLLSAEPKGMAKPLGKTHKPLIEIKNVSVAFPLKKNFFGKALTHVHAVNDANITLHKKETLGIVGESGSGKTTLAMATLHLQKYKGNIIFNNQTLRTQNTNTIRSLRQEMQIVFQDPFGSLNPRMTIAEILSEGLTAHHIGESKEARNIMAYNALEEVGIDPSAMERYPHEFSGGQRQRIAIARAIVLNPKLIILDEPTSALDLSVQAQILSLLKELQQKHDLSYIFISHDLRVIKSICHNIVVMKDGNIVESGTTKEIFEAPKTDYTKALIKAALENKAA